MDITHVYAMTAGSAISVVALLFLFDGATRKALDFLDRCSFPWIEITIIQKGDSNG